MCSTGQVRYAAIVTGASSGIGLAVSSKLAEMGYEVFGIGRNFSDDTLWQKDRFHAIVCDLLDKIGRASCRERVLAGG